MIRAYLRQNLFFFLAVFFALFILYFPQLTGDFIGDDVGRIKDIPESNYFAYLYSFLGDRPLLVVLMWLDRIFFGLGAFGMKLENIILVSFTFVVARELVNKTGEYFQIAVNPLLRDFVLFLFAIHPLNTQAFGHVIQRGALIATLFSLCSTWLIIHSKGSPGRFAWKIALLFWCLALMAKPNIAFMPIWWGLLLWMGNDKKNIPYLLAFVLMLFIPIAGYVWGEFNLQTDFDNVSSWQYFLTQGRVILIYLKLLVWPDKFYFMYELQASGPREFFPGLLLWIGYFTAVFSYLYFGKNKAIKIFIIGGILAFIPESSFFKIIHLIFEHRSFAPFLLIISAVSFIQVKIKKQILTPVFAALILVFGARTFARSIEVKTYEGWALNDFVQGGCKVPYNIYYVGHQFVMRGKFDELETMFSYLDNCLKDTVVKSLLEVERDLIKSDKLSAEIFERYKTSLHSDNAVVCLIRNKSNMLFIEKTLKTDGAESACYAEELISHQLKYSFDFRASCSATIDFYYLANNACMIELRKEPQKNKNKILKLRLIRSVYFNAPDGKLEQDLRSSSHDPEVEYYLELYESSQKRRNQTLNNQK